MPAPSASRPYHKKQRAFLDFLRNLLLYFFLFNLFAFFGFHLFSGSEGDLALSDLSDTGNLFNQLAVPLAFLIVCILVYTYRIPVRVVLAVIMPMAPLLLLIVLSTTWSDYPDLTIRRAVHEVLEATALGLLATCFSNPNIVLVIFFRAFLIIGCLDLISCAVFPETFTKTGFAGIHAGKNVAGQFYFAALPVYLLGTFYREISGNRFLGALGFVSGVAMLVLTESKTSIAAVVFGFSLVLLTRGLFSRNPAVLLSSALFCLVGLVGAIAAVAGWDHNDLLQTLVGDPTLTGRDQIWAYVETKFDASPIVGVGYGAIWQIGPTLQLAFKAMGLWFVYNEAHNGYLDIAAQLGIAGICCLVIYLTATLFNVTSYWAKLEQNRLCGAGALATYIFWGLILCNITESIYFQTGGGIFCILIFFGAFAASRSKRSMAEATVNAYLRAPRPVTT
jgi:exopolysaccharide production protein ExoQ